VFKIISFFIVLLFGIVLALVSERNAKRVTTKKDQKMTTYNEIKNLDGSWGDDVLTEKERKIMVNIRGDFCTSERVIINGVAMFEDGEPAYWDHETFAAPGAVDRFLAVHGNETARPVELDESGEIVISE
jgi:hypothetical protein